MRVRCVRNEISMAEADKSGMLARAANNRRVTVGETYLVLGIDVVRNQEHRGTGVFFQVNDDGGRPSWGGWQLFGIVDAHASHHWEVEVTENGGVLMQPREFFDSNFHNDLAEGEPGAAEIYERVVNRLASEF